MKDFFIKTEPIIQSITNGTSLGLSFLVVVLLTLISFYFHDLSRRATFRIQGMLALLDIIRHLTIFVYQMPHSPFCMFAGFFGFFGDTLYVLLNVAIAMNIYLIGIKNIMPSRKLHVYMISSAIAVTFILNFGAYIFDVIGPSPNGVCFIKSDISYRNLVKFVLIQLPNIPGVLYCAYVSIRIIIKFYPKKAYENETILEVETPRMPYIDTILFIRSLYLRIAIFLDSSEKNAIREQQRYTFL